MPGIEEPGLPLDEPGLPPPEDGEGMLGLELPPERPEAPPLDPDEPPEELGELGEGRDVDWLAQPPIRKAETAAIAVTSPARTSTRFHE